MQADLVIRNAKIVNAYEITDGDIAIDEGKILAIGRNLSVTASNKTFDAGGKYVVPGAIDPHVHVGYANPLDQDCKTETSAAAAGGVTSIIHFLIAKGGKHYGEIFSESRKTFEEKSLIDFTFHAYIMGPRHVEELSEYFQMGITSFKFLMSGTYVDPAALADDKMLYYGMATIARLGPPAIGLVHAELPLVYDFMAELKRKGREDLPAWTEARPAFCEEEAIRRALFFAGLHGSRVYIVHISTETGAKMVTSAKGEGIKAYSETCTHFLTHTVEDRELGVLGKVTPPLRTKRDREGLWLALSRGAIDVVASDHVATKGKGKGGLWSAIPGFPNLQMTLPVLLSEGVNKGRLTMQEVVRVTSTNVAIVHGLLPQKGTISVGADADLVVVDPDKEVKIDREILLSSSDYSLYDGWKFKGWPTHTMVRGNMVVEDGHLVSPSRGRFLPRKPS